MSETENNQARPSIVTIISILYLFIGVINAIINLISFILNVVGNRVNGQAAPTSYLLLLFAGLVLGVLTIITGAGLFVLKAWAYKAAIGISGLSILIYLYAFLTTLMSGHFSTSIIIVLIHVLILGGLFSKHVKAAFSSV